MSDDVTVGVTGEAGLTRPAQARQGQLLAEREGVDVDTDADARHRGQRAG